MQVESALAQELKWVEETKPVPGTTRVVTKVSTAEHGTRPSVNEKKLKHWASFFLKGRNINISSVNDDDPVSDDERELD